MAVRYRADFLEMVARDPHHRTRAELRCAMGYSCVASQPEEAASTRGRKINDVQVSSFSQYGGFGRRHLGDRRFRIRGFQQLRHWRDCGRAQRASSVSRQERDGALGGNCNCRFRRRTDRSASRALANAARSASGHARQAGPTRRRNRCSNSSWPCPVAATQTASQSREARRWQRPKRDRPKRSAR